MSKQKTFTQSVKGKIIIASVFACIALFLAWGTSKLAFEEMLDTVENISTPSERLRIVNSLSLKIVGLDQLQKSKVFHKSRDKEGFLKESKKLILSIDTLSRLYKGDTAQLGRIASVKKLLKDREQLFLNYIQVREGFLNSDFSKQIESVNNLVEENSRKTDSTIRQSEKRTLTTTVYN
ncbi:MAG: hybrid sensor histidine kinase/response regulator, partial [Pedobacter sp.]